MICEGFFLVVVFNASSPVSCSCFMGIMKVQVFFSLGVGTSYQAFSAHVVHEKLKYLAVT